MNACRTIFGNLRRGSALAAAGFAFAIVIRLTAQAQSPPPAIRFEVASVRQDLAGPAQDEADNPSFAAYRAGKAASFCIICVSGRRYDVYGLFLKELIALAFKLDQRLVVGPDWLNRFEGTKLTIHALMPEGATKEQEPEMLRALLEERFHLVAHRAPAEQMGYALVAAKNGPRLKEPRQMDRSSCEPWSAGLPAPDGTANQICRTTQTDGDSTLNIAMSTNTSVGPMRSVMSRGETLETHAEYFSITMPQVAGTLARQLSTGSPFGLEGSLVQVVDRTRIDGNWDVVLDSTFGDMALPTLSASLEKQGLRLERITLPVEKLIVDKVDKLPTEN